jgi:hypothetical protein
MFTLSSRGVSLLVHRRSAAGRARSASNDTPPVGNVVTVTATIDDQGDIEEQDINDGGKDTNGIELEGKVLSIDQQARTLTLSADDDDESGGTLLVHVPDTFDLTQFNVGQEVELFATLQSDGSYLLVGSASDDNEQEADDENEQHGTFGDDGEHGQQGAQGPSSGHGDKGRDGDKGGDGGGND